MGVIRRGAPNRVRLQIATEAARLMLWEGVSQYMHAKRIAARRVLGREAAGVRYRPRELPSNGEIRAALLSLVDLSEGADRQRRLFAMRVEALTALSALDAYHARLIGSVWSGHAHRGSDIDLHVFTDTPDRMEIDLWTLGWTFEREEVLVRTGSAFTPYVHLHVLHRPFPVELSVYPLEERRVSTRSSIDQRPIERVSAERLQGRIEAEHPDAWTRTIESGELDLQGLDGEPPGEFDALLTGPVAGRRLLGDGRARAAAEPQQSMPKGTAPWHTKKSVGQE
jgi:hypothetical protein